MAKPLPEAKRQAVLAALRMRRVAQWVARDFAIATSTVTRLARRHGIALVSQSEHMKSRRHTPEFTARWAPAQRKAASAWLRAHHEQVVAGRKRAAVARVYGRASDGEAGAPEEPAAPGPELHEANPKGDATGPSASDRSGVQRRPRV